MNDHTNELYHYGIRGMKWGVRRYQNKDGSLTPAGKKRAAKLEVEYEKTTGKKLNSSSGGSSQSSKKSIKDMTDEELTKANNRMRLEKEYTENQRNYMTAKKQIAEMTPQQVSAGKKFVSGVGSVLVPAIKSAAQAQATKFLNKQLGKLLGVDADDVSDGVDALAKEVKTMNLKKQKNELNKYFNEEKARKDREATEKKVEKEIDDFINEVDRKNRTKQTEYTNTGRNYVNEEILMLPAPRNR